MRSLDDLPQRNADSDTDKRLLATAKNQALPKRIRIALFEQIRERQRYESSGLHALNRFHFDS